MRLHRALPIRVHHARNADGSQFIKCLETYHFINDNTCPLCNMRAEILNITLLFARPWPPRAPHFLSRVFQTLRNLPNQYFFYSLPANLRHLLLNDSSLLPRDLMQ